MPICAGNVGGTHGHIGWMVDIGPDPVAQLDARLTTLVVGAARWRLALGEALERLVHVGGPRALGFSSMAAYAVERCGTSGRWVEDARGLARRLAGLPRLRAALGTGAVTWSMAQLVARHATTENEVELVEAARTSTVRAMRERLESGRSAEPDEAPARRTIETVVPVEDAWAFERARVLVEAVVGEGGDRSTDTIVEAMLAETLTSLLPPPGGKGGADFLRDLDGAADGARFRAEGRVAHDGARDALEAAFDGLVAPRVVLDDAPILPDGPDGDDPVALDGAIVDIASRLHSRDLEIGRLAREMQSSCGWRALGFVTFAHFVRERLGMSLAAMQAKMSLARRCEALPALGEALREGRLGATSATLVARVADASSVGAWVERAQGRTFKHLREEVEAAGLLARVSGDAGWLAPPEDDTLAEVQRFESAVLAGEVDVQMSVARVRTGRVPLRVDVATDVADLWMAVRALHGRRGHGDSFVATLARNITRTWRPEPMVRPFEDVYRRDRYRCQSPTCDRRDVGAHHVVFRARGGGDEPDNLVTVCGACHLEGLHAGTIHVRGRATCGLTWTLGGVLTVVGRVRQRPGAAAPGSRRAGVDRQMRGA
ncbi:MAG: HNH endonuclease [Deltaproteobacteria bacterium]|nr:HNH endonuclease [Deltaproteobacteria bacterium]